MSFFMFKKVLYVAPNIFHGVPPTKKQRQRFALQELLKQFLAMMSRYTTAISYPTKSRIVCPILWAHYGDFFLFHAILSYIIA